MHVKKSEEPVRGEAAQHYKVAVRQVDDAHHAEHEVQAQPHQAEVKAEQEPAKQRVLEHNVDNPGRLYAAQSLWTRHLRRSAVAGGAVHTACVGLRGRIDRLAIRYVVRIDRHELHAAFAVADELAERRDFADLRSVLVEHKVAVQRFQLA